MKLLAISFQILNLFVFMCQFRESHLIEMNSHCIVVVSGGLVRNNCVAVMTLSLFGFGVLKLDLECKFSSLFNFIFKKFFVFSQLSVNQILVYYK
jgi:hypothetical protein